jgi:hypothetical protein
MITKGKWHIIYFLSRKNSSKIGSRQNNPREWLDLLYKNRKIKTGIQKRNASRK